MQNFQLLICLSEDILILFMNDDNYMRDLEEVMELLQKQDPTHFRDVQLRIFSLYKPQLRWRFLIPLAVT